MLPLTKGELSVIAGGSALPVESWVTVGAVNSVTEISGTQLGRNKVLLQISAVEPVEGMNSEIVPVTRTRLPTTAAAETGVPKTKMPSDVAALASYSATGACI